MILLDIISVIQLLDARGVNSVGTMKTAQITVYQRMIHLVCIRVMNGTETEFAVVDGLECTVQPFVFLTMTHWDTLNVTKKMEQKYVTRAGLVKIAQNIACLKMIQLVTILAMPILGKRFAT